MKPPLAAILAALCSVNAAHADTWKIEITSPISGSDPNPANDSKVNTFHQGGRLR
ncbi:MAG: hypothetical protein U0793_24040 [Gemmataceae bacterium]